MVKVFIPEVKRKYSKKNLARGFWQNESGKIYYDYLRIKEYNQEVNGFYYREVFYNYLDLLRECNQQECIFFIENGQGKIYYTKDRIEILQNRIYQEVTKENLKKEIKNNLKKYSGITIYKINNKYFIEVFYK